MQTSPTELLARLDYTEPASFPKAALKEIIARRDEMIPHLISILESAHANPAEYLEGPQVMLPTYAAYLLAQFRETRAYRPLLALLNLEGNRAEQFFGDSLTEDIHNILACVFDGDETPLRALIENPLANEYARACGGLHTYASLIQTDRIAAAEVERYFHDLLDHKLGREHSHAWNKLAPFPPISASPPFFHSLTGRSTKACAISSSIASRISKSASHPVAVHVGRAAASPSMTWWQPWKPGLVSTVLHRRAEPRWILIFSNR